MKKKIRINKTKTKNYRVGFSPKVLSELRSEAEAKSISLSMHIQDILLELLPPRLGELIASKSEESIAHEYTSFVITQELFSVLDRASKSVNYNVPELCRDILAERKRLAAGVSKTGVQQEAKT